MTNTRCEPKFQPGFLEPPCVYFSVQDSDVVGGLLITGSTPNQTAVIVGQLSPFPGSTQIMVSHDLWVYPAARGKGYSRHYNTFMLDYAYQLGKRAIIATVKPDNLIQHQRLTKLGWKRLTTTLWMTKTRRSNENR